MDVEVEPLPNGLLVDGTKFVIGGWGSAPKADFTNDTPGHIFVYDPATKTKTLVTKKPIGNIDGLESDGNGGYLATDYIKGKLYHVTPTGDFKEVRTFKPGTADIGYVPASKILLVPHMNESQVAAYDLSADLTTGIATRHPSVVLKSSGENAKARDFAFGPKLSRLDPFRLVLSVTRRV